MFDYARLLRMSFYSRKDESGALLRLGALFETALRGRVGAAEKERPAWLSGFAVLCFFSLVVRLTLLP
jgi:hypothetical protein